MGTDHGQAQRIAGTTNIAIDQMLTKKARERTSMDRHIQFPCGEATPNLVAILGGIDHGQALLIHSLISCLQNKAVVQ